MKNITSLMNIPLFREKTRFFTVDVYIPYIKCWMAHMHKSIQKIISVNYKS